MDSPHRPSTSAAPAAPTVQAAPAGAARRSAPPLGSALLSDAVRLAALEATDIRSAARADALRPMVRLAARALRVPVAQINLVTADAQIPVVASAMADPLPTRWEVPVSLEASYCQYVVTSGAPLLIGDARQHPLVKDNRATTEGGIVAYAGVPVRTPSALGEAHGGQIVGTVCVVDFAVREWTAEDRELLEDLSAAITAELGTRADAATEAARSVAFVADGALRQADEALADSEGRFRTLANSIPQLAWMADAGGTIVWFNRRWYDYTGMSPQAMGSDDWIAVHHPEHAERVIAGFRAAVAARTPWEDTFPLRGHDGAYRWFLSRAVPVTEPGPRTVRWFGTGTDITDRMDADAERERLLGAEHDARVAAEEAGRAKSRFLATMSHELRTPLNAIGGYAELLAMGLRGAVTEAQHADLSRIRRSQQHLLGLINDILNFVRLESGSVVFACEDVPVAASLQDVSTMILPQAVAKGLGYRIAPCEGMLAARADREKLRQVLLNLLSNAVKFTRAPGRVEFSCEAGPDTIRYLVRDTGDGIPPDKREAIFEPFVQVRSEFSRTAEGTGLGLAISRDLARGMGGELSLELSSPETGSTFVLTLPRAGDVEGDAASSYTPDVPVEAAVRDLSRLLARGEAGTDAIREEAVHAALGYLNARTAHRYTGLYRFDRDVLRNVALFDRESPGLRVGADAPLGETYCAIVGAQEATFATENAPLDPRTVAHLATRGVVVSYCGALVRTGDGRAVGTLCSFDVEARPVPTQEIPLLEAAAPLLAPAVVVHGATAAA